MVPALLVWGYLQGGSPSFLGIRTYQSNAAAGRGRGVSATRRPSGVVIRRVGRLPGAVQDAAVAARAGTVYAFGGLDRAGSSASTVTSIRGRIVRAVARLPVAVHDAAAVTENGSLYVLGGGQLQSFAGIGRFDAATGRTSVVASFATPLSDLAAVTAGRVAYVVGGYSGSAFSSRIYGFSGVNPRVVAHLPVGLRYAAVAAIGGSVLIAGGRTPSGPT